MGRRSRTIRRSCVSGRCGWSPRCGRTTRRSGRRSARWPRSWASARAETLRKWVRQAEVDAGPAAGCDQRGVRGDQAAAAGERGAAPGERDPEGGVGFLRGRARPATAALVRFIDEHKARFGVEPICRVLSEHGCQIAPSTYYDAATPGAVGAGGAAMSSSRPRSAGSTQDNYGVYGARKVWLALNREGIAGGPVHGRAADARAGPARRPPRASGSAPRCRTAAAARPADLVRRQFSPAAPNRLWVADFTYVPDLVRDGLRRVRHRRLLPPHPGLAGRHHR